MSAGVDVLERARDLERDTVAFDAYESPTTWLGWLLLANDELDAARRLLAEQHRRAIDDGDDWSRTWLHWPLTELECRAGNLDAARAYAEEGAELAEQVDNPYSLWLSPYCRALVAAHSGDAAAARVFAEESLVQTEAIHGELFAARPRIVLGFLAVSEERYADALQHLAGLSELALTGPYWVTYPFWGDLFEAFAALGELERAHSQLADIERHLQVAERPGTAAVLARCRGLVLAASGSLDEAVASLEDVGSPRAGAPGPTRPRTNATRARRSPTPRQAAPGGARGASKRTGELRVPRRHALGRACEEGDRANRRPPRRMQPASSHPPSGASPSLSPMGRRTRRSRRSWWSPTAPSSRR